MSSALLERSIPEESREAIATAIFGADKGMSLGVYLIALFMDAMMMGLLVMQFVQWCSYQKNERHVVKALAYGTFALSITATTYLMSFVMHLFVYNFGTYSQFISTQRVAFIVLFDCVMALMAQLFYAHRSFMLNNRNWYLLVLILVLAAAGFAASIRTVHNFRTLDDISEVTSLSVPTFIWLACILACDLTITTSILYGLFRSKTGLSKTDELVNKLLRICVESQLPPTCIAIAFMINCSLNPNSSILAIYNLTWSKFYACGLLACLNSRYTLRRQLEASDHNSYPLTTRHDQTIVHVNVETDTRITTANGDFVQLSRPGVNRSPYVSHGTTSSSGGGDAKEEVMTPIEENVFGDDESHWRHSDEEKDASGGMDYLENPSKTKLTA